MGRVTLKPPVFEGDDPITGPHPEPDFRVFRKLTAIHVTGRAESELVGKHLECVTIEARQSATGSNPEISIPCLAQAGDGALRQAVVGGPVLDLVRASGEIRRPSELWPQQERSQQPRSKNKKEPQAVLAERGQSGSHPARRQNGERPTPPLNSHPSQHEAQLTAWQDLAGSRSEDVR